jgi:hypothetical protein
MRTPILALIAVVLLAVIFVGFLPFVTPVGGAAAYVPDDALFVVCAKSVNHLRKAMSGFGQNNADPATELIGKKINVPGLDGADFEKPIYLWVSKDRNEHALVPVVDRGAFQDAFDESRENLHMRDPEWIGGDYAYLSPTRGTPSARNRSGRAHQMLDYPVSAYQTLSDTALFRQFLGFPFAANPGRRVPAPVAQIIVNQCADLLVGLSDEKPRGAAAQFDLRATLRPGALSRAPAVALKLDPARLARALPPLSQLFLAAALDADGWRSLGLPVDFGDAAIAFAAVRTTNIKRPHAFALAVQPKDASRLDADPLLKILLGSAAQTEPTVTRDETATIRTWTLEAPPPLLAPLVRKRVQGAAPPVRVSVATERGVLLLAVGSSAPSIVQVQLAGLRGEATPTVAETQHVSAHPGFNAPGHVAIGMVTERGLRALGDGLPTFLPTAIGQPEAATFVVDVADGEARATVLLSR